ncbi:MAG: CDP-diacylglycerol--glycerol-3-phosphate 3-phosphatidyltransferase [Clostridia bacterium]|nr:CDP-diacylglycerol--glycerol-3-phosphate 3-phosphatidyltransferase [Clostridia bacterium]
MKWNVPNILTMIRLACTPLVVLMFLLDLPSGIGIFVALGIYILACITDFLDGYIARKYNMVTDFGKFMDQIADKAITTSAMVLVLLATRNVTVVWLAIVLVLTVILRDTIISGIRMVAANKKIVIAADIFGKIKSLFLDVASMVLMLYVGLTACLAGAENAKIGVMPIEYIRCLGLSLMVVGAGLAVVSCVNYSVKAVKALKALSNEKAEEKK